MQMLRCVMKPVKKAVVLRHAPFACAEALVLGTRLVQSMTKYACVPSHTRLALLSIVRGWRAGLSAAQCVMMCVYLSCGFLADEGVH